MRFYRVHYWLPSAGVNDNGHPLYIFPRQGAGRIDNPSQYKSFYVAESASCAIGETLGSFGIWSDELLDGPPSLPGSVRAISEYEGDPKIMNLDDAQHLVDLRLRPSDVVSRVRSHTQAWAYAVFSSGGHDGVRWWSYYDPAWGAVGLWDTGSLSVVKTEPLSRAHPAVVMTGRILNRVWRPRA